MKRHILLFLLLISFGAMSQEATLMDYANEGPSTVASSHAPYKINVDSSESKPFNDVAPSVIEKGITEKLIAQGNAYYSKMWYAEAARIFDLVLEQHGAEHSMELLSKAGDSHYFSGNLEKANKWYKQLYSRYAEKVPDDVQLRYNETLKGTGRPQITKPANPTTWKGASLTKIKNLSINSPYSDFSPMFHKISDLVFASARDTSFLTTRRYRWNNQPFLDLYVAQKKNDEGELFGPKKFSRKINTKYHEASVAFTPDQKTIYFTRNNYGKKLKRGKEGVNHLKIYRSKWVDNEWTEAEELPLNSENYSTGHPAISPDGKKMYFVSDRPGGYGETDIYVVDILENGELSEPENLGRTVNTDAKEMFPYVTEDALYFSSNRPMGLGGLDVYRSDVSNNIFSVAVNLGEPINSIRDDFSYIIDASGRQGYFASNRKGGKGDDDIYSFVQTENLNAISGEVKDVQTGELLENATVQLLDSEGTLLAEYSSNAVGGYIFPNLSPNTKYTIKTAKQGYFDDSRTTSTKTNEGIVVNPSLKVLNDIIDTEKNMVSLDPEAIHFDFDSFGIRYRAAQELDKLVAVLKQHKNLVIKIESHTDAIGNAAYNKYLSDKRANSTKDYLISKGVDSSQIESAIGYGEERLLNNCSDGQRCAPEKHRLNRRSEFIIVSQ
ncbi:OmpA family protein [Allomuricauda taeanensis]|uniref:OmpA family protein n=1 Tax=Flagellimonas taeanensis TaxID=1005926 RepID=UPI002E7C2293|nr:OmpA family protein [Allomuricauda taeanensis]MEE1961599.1 OmpA family protein [Allomuricauda taeanensis]